MKLFIDTANLNEIKEIARWGVVSGVTTNPKILAQEDADVKSHLEEILDTIPGPLSIEVTSNEPDEMIVEAQRFASWSDKIVVKVPMSPAGLEVVTILTQKNIKTNVTAVMTVNQSMLAALAGTTYVSIFLSRIYDLGYDGIEVVRQTATLFRQSRFSSQIIVGSIRLMSQVHEAALAGADIVTVPYKFFSQLATHPQTEKTIAEFLAAWQMSKIAV